jgi:hypothetical protein
MRWLFLLTLSRSNLKRREEYKKKSVKENETKIEAQSPSILFFHAHAIPLLSLSMLFFGGEEKMRDMTANTRKTTGNEKEEGTC